MEQGVKFVYYPNPLRTRVYLDDKEKENFKLKYKLDQFKDVFYGVKYYLKEDPNKILECPNPYRNGKTYWSLAKNEVDFSLEEWQEELDQQANELIEDLQGYHVGDCTCIPCSCMKCYAEYLAGIDTIPGLGKHEASKIDGLFFANKRMSTFDIRTIDEVLDILKNYKVEPFEENEVWNKNPESKEIYEFHSTRWIKEAEHAYKWLLNYKEEHGF